MYAAPRPTLTYGPIAAPGREPQHEARGPPRKMSFSARGDSPANASSAQYGSISHDGRSRNRPSRSRMPAENERLDVGVRHRRRAEDARRIARPMRVNTPGLSLLADLEREHQLAEDPAARAVVELDLEPVVARAALEHLEHLVALGDVDLAIAGARAGVDRRLLRDHAQVRLGVGARGAGTEHHARDHAAARRGEGKAH